MSLAPAVPAATAAGQQRRRGGHLVRAVLAAAAVGLLVVGLRTSGLLSGPVAVLLVTVVVLLVPTSRDLSLRMLLTGSITLGWLVALWWVPLPVGSAGRATWLLALTAAGLAGWVAAGDSPQDRARRLVPRVAHVDVIPWLTALTAVWLQAPLLLVRDGASALATMAGGWDNSAHFAMVRMLREHGATIDTLGSAPHGETWKFADYPQGYHSVVATVMELLGSPTVESAGRELVLMTQATGWVVVAGATMLAAGICALPGLRTRPLVAGPTTALVIAAFLLGPGGTALGSGFGNFLFACLLTACVPLVSMQVRRVPDPVRLCALGGLLVGVAHSWVLLVSLALPAAALALVALRRADWRLSRRSWLLVVAVVTATLLGGLRAVQILAVLQPSDVLTTGGGIETPELGTVAAVAAAAAALGIWAHSRREQGAAGDLVVRGAGLGVLVPTVGVVASAALAAFQLRESSKMSYYLWKYLTGVELVSFALAAVALSALVHGLGDTRAARPVTAAAASAVLSIAALQVFGFTGIPTRVSPIGATAPGTVQRISTVGAIAEPGTAASELVLAADVQVPDGSHGIYLTSSDDLSLHPSSAQQWYLALRGQWTVEADHRSSPLLPVEFFEVSEADGGDLGRAQRVLDSDPAVVVLVSPDRRDQIRSQLVDDDARERIVAW